MRMPQIRGNTAAKWSRRTASATQEYSEGVQNPRASWQASTIAAAGAQAAGVQAAIADKRFEKGVAKAGDARWKEKAAGKGAERFAPGVAAAESDYQKGFAPFASAINNVQLPPRGPKGDPKNIERVRVMAQTMRNVKLGK